MALQGHASAHNTIFSPVKPEIVFVATVSSPERSSLAGKVGRHVAFVVVGGRHSLARPSA